MEESKAKAKKVSCWCGCGEEAFIVVLGQYPLCLECGRQHFKNNRLVKEAVRA